MGAEQSTALPKGQIEEEKKAKISGQALDATINAVAAQVFDNVHGQLGEIQKEQVKTTEEIATRLQGSLNTHATEVIDSSICKSQMEDLLDCLRKNQENPLACSTSVESFTACSLSPQTG